MMNVEQKFLQKNHFEHKEKKLGFSQFGTIKFAKVCGDNLEFQPFKNFSLKKDVNQDIDETNLANSCGSELNLNFEQNAQKY